MPEAEVARGRLVPPPRHSGVSYSRVVCHMRLSCLNFKDVSFSPVWHGFRLAPGMATSFQCSLWYLLTEVDRELWIGWCWSKGQRGTDFTGLWIAGWYEQGYPRAFLNFTLWHYVWNRCCNAEGKANCEMCSVLCYRNLSAEVIETTWMAGDSDSSVSWCPITSVQNWFKA